jgi:hypothetical protein
MISLIFRESCNLLTEEDKEDKEEIVVSQNRFWILKAWNVRYQYQRFLMNLKEILKM